MACKCRQGPKPRLSRAPLATATATIGVVEISLGDLGGTLHWVSVFHVSAAGVVGNWRAYFAKAFLVRGAATQLAGGGATQANFGTGNAIPLVPLTRMDARNTAGSWLGPMELPEDSWLIATLVNNRTPGTINTETDVAFSPFDEKEG